MKKQWKTPMLSRLIAGAAETSNRGSISDGGTSPSGTNFRS
jgi:hypothetical protein